MRNDPHGLCRLLLLISAFLLELFPFPPSFPDFLLVTLLVLSLLPDRPPPFGTALVMGLLLDVARGDPLGETALCYLLLLYLTALLRPYLSGWTPLSYLIYAYLAQLLAVLLRAALNALAGGGVWIAPDLWLGVLSGTLLFWPIYLLARRLMRSLEGKPDRR